jgi:hypothetical protein
MAKHFLFVAISKLVTEEQLAVGPARARYRNKRMQAVEVFRRRFGDVPITEYGERTIRRLGQR